MPFAADSVISPSRRQDVPARTPTDASAEKGIRVARIPAPGPEDVPGAEARAKRGGNIAGMNGGDRALSPPALPAR